MMIKDTQTCGVQEIVGLGEQKSPEEAMESFCANTLDNGNVTQKFWTTRNSRGKTKLFCFYLFTQGGLNWYAGKKAYGELFAAFIAENDLGTVVEPGLVRNEAFHPKHSNRAFLWAPHQVKLEKWWKVRLDAKDAYEKELLDARIANQNAFIKERFDDDGNEQDAWDDDDPDPDQEPEDE